MRSMILATVLAATTLPAAAFAQAAPSAPAHYTVENTDIGTLLDDPAARAVLDKHMPGFTANDQIEMARSMTLKSVQQYASDKVTDKALVDIQTDLNKLPAK